MSKFRDQSGFTLIEIMVAITLFAILTIGIVPLLASSLRGSTLSRSYTVGKNLAVEAMERVRGLPYNIAIDAQPSNDGVNKTKVDVLDFYFPCATSSTCGGAGTTYSIGTFKTTCTSTSANPACPKGLPSAYTSTFTASFVKPTGLTPETYAVLTGSTTPSLATYDWKTTNRDRAPSKLLQIKVSVAWSVGGLERTYDLETLKAERKFGSEKIAGSGQVDYAIRVVTGFGETGAEPSTLTATGASGSSTINLRLNTISNQVVRAGEISLIQEGTLTSPAVVLATTAGATSSIQAPPDQTPPATSADATIVTHPQRCQDPGLLTATGCQRRQVGHIAASEAAGLSVKAANELPSASGVGTLNPSAAGAADLFVGGQLNALTAKNPLKLIRETSYVDGSTINAPILLIRSDSGVADNNACSPFSASIACRSMFASTSGATGVLGASDRRVETSARTGFSALRVFPVDFIPGSESASRTVLRITNFTAAVRCKATGTVTSSVAEAKWTATLDYWSEESPDDGRTKGGYLTTKISLSSSTDFSSVLAALKAANPMVYEVPDDLSAIPPIVGPQQGDVYLFPKTDVSGVHPSYLTDLTGSAVDPPVVGSDGKTASALISGALKLTTGPTDPDIPESSISAVLGALSCGATDRR